jgi:phosphoserine phosphatase
MHSVLTLVTTKGQLPGEVVQQRLASLLPYPRQESGDGLTFHNSHFDCADLPGLRTRIAEALTDLPVDFCLRPVVPKGHWKLLIADMDSTMITVECIDELGDFAGKRDEVVAITERAMRGEIDFEGALVERVALMKGLPGSALPECFDERVVLSPGAKAMVQGCRDAGMHCALVSGGFTYFTARVAEMCGFHENRANSLVIEGGVLTGTVTQPVLGRQSKIDALNELCARLGITPDQAVCIGDGANDIGMLDAAGLGVAYHAKPITRDAADACINHGGLDVLLRFLGV